VTRRIGLWLAAAALLMGGMQAVANHFLGNSKPAEENSSQSSSTKGNSGDDPAKLGASRWWLPPAGSIDPMDSILGGAAADTGSVSDSGPLLPIALNDRFPNSPLMLGSSVQIGANPWLNQLQRSSGFASSTPLAATPGAPSMTSSMAPFAPTSTLSDDVIPATANSAAIDGKTTALLPTPEPATGALLVLTMAGLALLRRRRQ
jgi:hypothetical protein